jgi:RimJ/RimL family protein N-acetyltransferase/acyl CoA:acetate/3-ketoacid CoA transferase beta subunit
VDIARAAADNAGLRIAQMNANMPRVHGDTFFHIKEIDFIISQDEPLIEFEARAPDDISQRIGKYVAEIIRDGDTIQVGYGSIPNAVLAHLKGKNHLGVHTELLSDGVADLMKIGVVDNSRKDIDRGKTVAAFCMGRKETYAFINDNPSLELRPVSYTNNPLTIARNRNMTAINSALEIDLTGQATAESLGRYFFSGIGGQADFMRGAMLSRGGKTILAMQSTAEGGRVSRIVPLLREGAGVTLTRGDLHYVVTEHGIAYLHGKNVRERAMDLIAIADPEFRPGLVDAARELGLIYKDQKFVPGEGGLYPETLETYRTTRVGLNILLRPVKITDEHRLKDFFYSLSNDCMYNRFISTRADMPHERLQRFVIVDYRKEMVILAALRGETGDMIVGLGQYFIDESNHTAEVAFVVRDDYQNMGIGQELLSYLTQLAKKNGLHGFTAEVLAGNEKMLHLFENSGFMTEKRTDAGTCELKMYFRET